MPKITVVGSLNMDLVIKSPKFPVLGETILGEGFITNPGGKGANQAVAVSRLGGAACMVGCVGNDAFGTLLIENLQLNDVDIKNVKILEGVPTGVAIIILNNGDNTIIVDEGANKGTSQKMLEHIEESIKNSDVLLIQLEIPMGAVKKAIEIAKKHGVKVILNPAPARKLDDGILANVDVLTPNESECEFITGLPTKSVEEAKQAAQYLLNKGISQVVITLGANGVVYNDGENIVHKPAYKVKAIDTTAAGDSFSGALAVALSNGKSMHEAIDFASKVGAITVTRLGAQASLPYLKEISD